MATAESAQDTEDVLGSSIAEVALKAHGELDGHLPGRARAFLRGDVVVVVLREVMGGELIHRAICAGLVPDVETLTGRSVAEFVSHELPYGDVTLHLYVLEGAR